MRHNSVRNIDSEVVGGIARASLRHEGEVPGTIVGRSCLCGTRQSSQKTCCQCVKRKLLHVISPKQTSSVWVRHGNGEAIDPLKENIFSHRINIARGRWVAPEAAPHFLVIIRSGGKQRFAFAH